MTIEYRLVTILAADVVGYTRLMENDELGTYTQYRGLRDHVLDPGIAAQNGRIIKHTGDGFLAVFESVNQAIACALSLQERLADQAAEHPPENRVCFRMALNLADVIVDHEDIHGDGVNIAARLQSYAPANGIVISGATAEQIGDELGVVTIDLGELHLRHIGRAVRVFELRRPAVPARLVGEAAIGSDQRPSLAVLPFRKHLQDPDEAYFADGIVDDIIHGLATLKELFVVSRGSAMGYGGAEVDVQAIGRDLGVRYVLYGSVRRTGGQLRIGTELSDAETGTVVDTNQYNGNLTDLFELQDRIAVSVVKTIAPHVQERELTRAMRKHPQDMTSYDLVLQALDYLYRMDYEAFSRARGLLQQAISHDPNYAPAYSYSALWHIFRVGEIGSPDPDADAEAAAAISATALDLDPYDALTLSISGHVHSFMLKDFRTAMTLLDRAIDAGPSLAMAWSMSSATCGFMGNGELAVERGEQGVRLSPRDARTFWHEGLLAQAHYVNGSYDEALEWAKSAVSRNNSIRFNFRTLIAILSALGKDSEAAEAAQKFLRIQPGFKLGEYVNWCPFQGADLERWISHLKSSGLPE